MKRYIHVIIIAVTTLLVFMALFSCTSVKYVPVETVRENSAVIKQWERDSIFIKDSIFISTKADTVYHTRIKWLSRDRVIRDTVYRVSSDTITKVVKVEKALTGWEKAKMSVGGYTIVCCAILVAIWFAKRLKGL